MFKRAGFTLIELLVVVLIIGVLSAVALPQYQKVVAKTRAMRLLPLLRSISDAENVFYLSNGRYTLDFTDLDVSMPAGAKTVTSSRVEFDHWHCYLRRRYETDNTSYSAYCNDDQGKVYMEKYFSSKEFICWGNGSETAMELCRNISGKETPTLSTGGAAAPTGFSF